MKKSSLILAASLIALVSSCQKQQAAQDDSNYHDRRMQKSCGSCEAEKAQAPQVAEPAQTAVAPAVKVEEKKAAVVAEVKPAPVEVKVEKVEKAETAATPEVKVEKAK